RVEADAAEGELDHVGAADEDRAGGAQPRYRGRIRLCPLLQDPGAGPRHVARDIEEILQRYRQPVDARAAHPALSQPVGVIGVGSRLAFVHLEERARPFPIGRGDARERLVDELAARRAAGGEIAAELGYSPHEGRIVCGGHWQTYSLA